MGLFSSVLSSLFSTRSATGDTQMGRPLILLHQSQRNHKQFLGTHIVFEIEIIKDSSILLLLLWCLLSFSSRQILLVLTHQIQKLISRVPLSASGVQRLDFISERVNWPWGSRGLYREISCFATHSQGVPCVYRECGRVGRVGSEGVNCLSKETQ